MKRNLGVLLVAAVLAVAPMRAEFLQIDLSIFGMD